ncbi:MAG: transglutaminase-like domain-containing protein [Defluviitaleaceae bacterium]|nr:transglutaminase-like domain-containing protein [Defluviitaleaceae bacterium]
MRKGLAFLCFGLMLLLAACGYAAEEEYYSEYPYYHATEVTLLDFRGRWQGEHPNLGGLATFDIVDEDTGVTLSSFAAEFFPVDWEMDDGRIVLGMNSEEFRITMIMSLSEDKSQMTGIFTQFGETSYIVFEKLSDFPQIGNFRMIWEPVSLEERVRQLNQYPGFADDGTVINFTYDLGRRDLYMDLIEEFDLDTITTGLYDVDLMLALLDWVSDNFAHDGSSGMPRQMDAMSIIYYTRNNPMGGINCRGLAVLLAEVLRLYGIPAKHITGYPPENDHPVHVVTHAFSSELQQWIMLDPTVRMFVTDENGNFMNLYTLRRAFADGTTLIANENASHNGRPYSIEEYKDFMSDYLFRFSTGTHFTFGSEETGAGTTQFMLVPAGFHGSGGQRITSSAEAFFAIPSQYQ